jgi:uncharacterized protein
MICPACGNGLKSLTVGDISVDACEGGCGGIWFDNFELQRIDEPHEQEGQALLNIPVNPEIQVDMEMRRNCPRCPDLVMMRHFFRGNIRVQVDSCPGCGGYWLDAGELGEIRNDYLRASEQAPAELEHASGALSPEDVDGRDISAEPRPDQARTIGRLFRYVGPRFHSGT